MLATAAREAFAFFGGVPARLVADNLKTGGGQAGPVRPEDQPLVCRVGLPLRHPDRPGPGGQASLNRLMRSVVVCDTPVLQGD